MRVKKERDVQIVHFSFFDLLFGAFGAFVFLMILHVIKTINMVDIDLRKTFDELVKEKNTLVFEVQKHKEKEKIRSDIEKMYRETVSKLRQSEKEKMDLSELNNKYKARIDAMEREVATLTKLKDEFMKKGDIQKVLERESDQLRKSLEAANQKLTGLKTVELKIKTGAFPTTLIGENVHLAIAAEGGSPPYRWDYEGDLPDGLSFDKENGIITGQTKEEGDFKFAVSVTDARGMSASSLGEITLPVIKRPVEKKEGVSRWFVVMTIIISLLLLYILWEKYKVYLYCKRMREQGYKAVWVKG